MKRKIFSVFFALVLVLSFSLVTAVPVAASPGTLNVLPYTLYSDGNGTAAWSTVEKHTGNASVLLTHTDNVGSVCVDFVPPAGETLATFQADITATTPDWGFWHFTPDTPAPSNWAQFELYFDDPDSTGFLEVTAVGLQNYTGTAAWVEETLAGATLAGYGGWGEAGESGSFFNWGPLTALSGIEAAVNGEGNVTSASDWALTRVRVELWEDIDRSCYIDDIEIAGVTYYGLIQDAIDVAAATGDTISVAAGTYSAETTWPIDVDKALIIQGAGASTTTIAPGSAGQGVIAISADNVTIDGFTITGGSQAYTSSLPQEHAVWVAANYSTIKNNTIINYRGNQAGLYIGGRTAGTPTASAIYGYQVSKPLGHTIEDNTFRQAGSGEGWGIFAYDLTDSLIHGNTFVGDAADAGTAGDNWNNDEGAPGTAIQITNATAGTATGSPGDGYVVIEDNTAQYIKYCWLAFNAMYTYSDADGYGYEQPEASTVDKVIVRNNIVHDIEQKDNGTSWSVGVKFMPGIKSDAYGIKGASLTIGSNKVTIGPGNQIYDSDIGIEVGCAEAFSGGTLSHAGVLNADNISINYNLIYGMTAARWGVENDGSNNTVGNVGQAAKIVDAESNWWDDIYGPSHTGNPYDGSTSGDYVTSYVDYSPWMMHTALASGWNIYSPPWAPDTSTNTPDEALDIIGTDSANVENAYYFNSSASTPAWAIATSLTPLEAIYLELSAASTIDVAFSSSYTAPPSRTMYQGWNLFGPAAFASMDVDEAIGDAYWGTGEASLVGWSHVESLAINQTATWTHMRGATIYAGAADNVLPTEGYWVYMVNQGTLGGFTYTPIAIDTTLADRAG